MQICFRYEYLIPFSQFNTCDYKRNSSKFRETIHSYDGSSGHQDKSFPTVDINFKIVICIPNVNNGKTNLSNLIGVALEKKRMIFTKL
jgi:hypothetical protein